MITQLQQKFTVEHAKYIVSFLFPEFSDIIDEFIFTITRNYSWVCIEAKRKAQYVGIDDRTKKDRKMGVRDPREMIEQSYHIDIGINNHTAHGLWGKITKQRMQQALDEGEISFRFWNFNYSYGQKKEINELQTKHIVEYLNKQGIGLPTVDEFYYQYYKD